MSFTNTPKNSASFTNRAKDSVKPNLWDKDNLPWGEDNLPWQDEEVVIGTDYANKAKNSASFANQAKS